MTLPESPLLKMGRSLLVCLEEQYTLHGITPPKEFCLRAGEDGSVVEDLDPWTGEDMCCSGLGFVRLGGEFPASNAFEVDPLAKRGSCWPISWAGELQIGIMRCYIPNGSSGDGTFRMATCPEHTQATVNYSLDVMIIKHAICCWVKTLPPGRLYQIQGIVPSGPRANCIQTLGNILVQVPRCC